MKEDKFGEDTGARRCPKKVSEKIENGWKSDLVMTEDEYGDNWEGEDKNQGDAEKNHKHLK